jgi:hypothetical protein
MSRRLVAAVLVSLVALAATASGAKKAPPGASCSFRGRYFPGGGKLEWKPDGHLHIRLRGFPAIPVAHAGDTLMFGGTQAINGSPRHGIAAIDMRTGRPLPFDPQLPAGTMGTFAALSPTTAYIAYGDDGPSAPQEIGAFDRSTGARLPAFAVHDYDDGVITGVLYLQGLVIISGGPPSGDGTTIGAYDPATGAALWRHSLSELNLMVTHLVTNGKLLFTDAPFRMMAAIDPRDGSLVPGWGSGLDPHAYPGVFERITGADASHVYGVTVHGEHHLFSANVIASAADGGPTTLRDLPANGGPLGGGIGPTILGALRTGLFSSVDAVYGPTGRLIGTVCSTRHLVAQRDARHLIAERDFASSSQLVELARPRR